MVNEVRNCTQKGHYSILISVIDTAKLRFTSYKFKDNLKMRANVKRRFMHFSNTKTKKTKKYICKNQTLKILHK